MGIENVKFQVRDRRTDQARPADTQVRFLDLPVGHMDGGLRDPVHVDEPGPLIAMALEPWPETLKVQRFTAENHQTKSEPASVGNGLFRLHELSERRGGLVENRDLLPA